jgi:hypothetical protein
MRRHVVGAFVIVRVQPWIFGRDPLEEVLEIAPSRTCCVFLNHQRSGRVRAKNG